MVRTGTEYERFVYDKLKRLFPDARVTLNDRITGKQSGLPREIDVSIIFDIEDSEMLYVVQCKDYATRPASITVLGEFSAVMKDVGAAKGFLVCTSGFARSNRQYARAMGIELLTFEDVRSERWHTDVQIPLIFIRKRITWDLTAILLVNADLASRHKGRAINVVLNIDYATISFDLGATSLTIKKYLQAWISGAGAFLGDNVEVDLLRPNLRLKVAGAWVECEHLSVKLATEKKYYLKYVTPSEYSHARDHIRDETFLLHFKVSGPSSLDDSFIRIPADLPVAAPLVGVIEEWTEIERAHGRGGVSVGQYSSRAVPAPAFVRHSADTD